MCRLTAAVSPEELLRLVLESVPGLRGVALLTQDDDTPVVSIGEPCDDPQSVPFDLSDDSEYRLRTLPHLPVSPEVLAVMELRLLYLDTRDTAIRLGNELAALAQAAKTDALTGLPNRHALDLDLERIDAASHAYAMVFIDLDGFKAINDHYGHALGDSLLKGYGLWLSRVTGPWGRVYRMGGDEYLLLMTDFPGPPEAFEAWAHERLQIPFVDGVSASMGIAWRHEADTVSDVMRLADQRMYTAKSDPENAARLSDRRAAFRRES